MEQPDSLRACRKDGRPSVFEAASWGLVALPTVAAALYGATRPWTITAVLACALAVSLPLAAAGLRPRGRAECLALACLAWIVIHGWTATLLPRMSYLEDLGAMRTIDRGWASLLPGTIDAARSLAIMTRWTVLACVFVAAVSLFRSGRWRERFLAVMAVGAGLVALLGVVQRLAGAPGILWEPWRPPGLFFAAWFYHGNAATFFAMCFPFLLCGLVLARGAAGRILFGTSAMLCVVAAWLNWSKVGFPLLVLAGGVFAARLVFHPGMPRLMRRAALAALAVLVVCAILFPILSPASPRWERLAADLRKAENYPRLLVADVTLDMAGDAGAFGMGPGTWARAFPFHSHSIGDRAPGLWRYAHQDYLQHLVEWGWAGVLPWAALLGMGFHLGVRRSAQLPHDPPEQAPDTMRWTSAAALAAWSAIAAHALIDFPFQILSLQLLAVLTLALLTARPERALPTR